MQNINSRTHQLKLITYSVLCLTGELGMHGLLNQAQSRGDPGASLKTKCTPKPTIGKSTRVHSDKNYEL